MMKAPLHDFVLPHFLRPKKCFAFFLSRGVSRKLRLRRRNSGSVEVRAQKNVSCSRTLYAIMLKFIGNIP
jgi:hypothetical protein